MLRKPSPHLLSETLLPLQSLHLYPSIRLSTSPPPPISTNPTSPRSESTRYLVVHNTQIAKHGRNGEIREAQSIFDAMRIRDVVSWTALLTAYVDAGDAATARKVFDEMPKRNAASWNAMISGYLRASKVTDAYELFVRMPVKNAVSFGAMIAGFAKCSMIREAEGVYDQMPMRWRDPVGSNALICGYLRVGKLDDAVRVFGAMKAKDVFSWSSMVDGFCKYGSIFDAREVFDVMPERNVVSWTSMIRGYVKAGMWEDGFILFLDMRRESVRVNSTTLSVMLDACSESSRIGEGVQIHGITIVMGFESDAFLGNSLIVMYSRAGLRIDSKRLFNCMKRKDMVSWNSLINGYIQHDAIEEAYELFEMMPEKDAVSWTSMVVGFANRGCMGESVRLFEHMPGKDEVAWTAIVSGFIANGDNESALMWFNRMVQESYRPNSITLSCVLSALSGLAYLNQGMQVHACGLKMGLGLNVTVQSSLISMYAKCGNMGDAYRVFSWISEPSLVIINAMITAFAQHGLAEEALKLFVKMQADGYRPNYVTFLGILSACAHAGFVEEGYNCFQSMSTIYGIQPGPDHYTCMVDLLGRAGMLYEALELIKSIPFKPSSDVWGALLNASKIHFNLEYAKVAAKGLLELEPNNATAYAVLSNMLSSAGLKEEGENVRMAMQSNSFRKNPGYSWIILDKDTNQPSAG
ncbi:pentatricopeptide repeat-containing protein At1g53600, mitochondrial [Ananas comosus]|uniref:Pentatricopeptide repeat-containing protein At1g53600, mitochondrial n=1 Tax=Ananas comosus TaxID=4615 RepID=A0A6P5GUN5_ANACO|nr:pentatricopeptide repeat-containing protein At1g53600, mitochondrial [Ananas comosus]